jgi:hypothetical protein
MTNKKCSVCGEVATKEIQVIWNNKEKFIPRCDGHVVKGYEGVIKTL